MGLTISGYDLNSISTLFSSFNKGSSNNTIGFDYSMLSEYNSIKSGTYYKLAKKYYADDTNPATKAWNDSKVNTVDELSRQKTQATELYDSANVLLDRGEKSLFNKVEVEDEEGNITSDYDRDKIYKAVKDFVDDYNDTVDIAEDSDVTGVLTATSGMTNLAAVNSKSLADIGITIGNDSKLSVDEDAFKKADMNQVKSLLNERGGFAYQVSAKASMINSALVSAATFGGYTNSGSLSMTGLMNSYNDYI
ncbi:MAG: flagellar filament capping protein FliD [Lachnospiraceae bacterium]|nr:flagellar filament capping protein FliD [Lachnospiraceae bacterium]